MVKSAAKRIVLRRLKSSDVNRNYLRWMNDKEVTRCMECRWEKFNFKSLLEYVKKLENSKTDYLFGIFLRETSRHIGNIKIGSINLHHNVADLGLFLGEKDVWGNGYATEAITLATEYAFKKLKLRKLYAGIYSNNIGSYRAFIKSGYKKAGRLKGHRVCGNKRVDVFLVEKLNI